MLFSARLFCGQLSPDDVGRSVLLAGWVDAFRDHGGLMFVHLRDRSGIVQIVFSPEIAPAEVCQRAAALHAEYCIAVRGEVRKRLAGTENPNIETGSIEVLVTELTVLAESDALPFAVSDKAMVAGASSTSADNVAEDLRLQYRYLDLRRPSIRDNLILRHRIFQCVREFLDSRISGNRDPGADRQHARRSPRLPGAQPRPSAELLRPAPVAANLQAIADDRRHGTLLPTGPLLPR